ncbi:MAG: hypothetical protein WAV11_03285 [Minisyncoccia bacterium]
MLQELERIIKEILGNQDKILSNINCESICIYLFLKNEHEKDNIKNNTLFQFVFRSYYKLDNAGLGDDIKDFYFKLLTKKKNDLGSILLELYKFPNRKGQNTIQFSFATKLLHTLDNNNPIFDAEVSDVIHKKRTGETKREKVKSCIEIYEYLKQMYSNLLKDSKVKKVILKFRKRFNVSESKISDIKALDFIIWSLGKVKRK